MQIISELIYSEEKRQLPPESAALVCPSKSLQQERVGLQTLFWNSFETSL